LICRVEVISARRYKTIVPEDRFQYMAVYEFESEETLWP
jgi:hypothetical protein